jgi:uncharacterized protein (TIGR04255 family)
MARNRRLTHAPVVEALVDFRCQLPEATRAEDLEALHAELKQSYPKQERQTLWFHTLQVQGETSRISQESRVRGYRYSGDAPYILQAHLGGLTCSRLDPYDSFAALVTEARSVWLHYARIAKPSRIVGLAVRYINRFKVQDGVALHDYFLTGPAIAPTLPQQLAGVESKVLINFEPGTLAIVTQRIEPPIVQDSHDSAAAQGAASADSRNDAGQVGLVFDIEVLRPVDLATESPDVWRVLDDLAKIKNRIFFESVTEKALEPYA